MDEQVNELTHIFTTAFVKARVEKLPVEKFVVVPVAVTMDVFVAINKAVDTVLEFTCKDVLMFEKLPVVPLTSIPITLPFVVTILLMTLRLSPDILESAEMAFADIFNTVNLPLVEMLEVDKLETNIEVEFKRFTVPDTAVNAVATLKFCMDKLVKANTSAVRLVAERLVTDAFNVDKPVVSERLVADMLEALNGFDTNTLE